MVILDYNTILFNMPFAGGNPPHPLFFIFAFWGETTNHHFKIINKIKINYYTNFEKLSPCFSTVIQIWAEAKQFFSGKQKYCLRKYLSAIQKCRLCINKIKINYYTHFEKLSPCVSAVIQIWAETEHFFSGKQKYCLRKYLSAIQKCSLCINKIKINYYTHFEKLSPCGDWRGCSLKGKRHTFFTSSKTTVFKAIKIIFYFLVH